MSNNPYEINVDQEQCIVRLIVRGEVSKDIGKEIITKARRKAAETQCNILCDVRQAKVKTILIDWYYLPRELEIYQSTRAVKTAILITSGQQEEEYQFFETVTHNLGIGIKVFHQENDAISWLKKVDEKKN